MSRRALVERWADLARRVVDGRTPCGCLPDSPEVREALKAARDEVWSALTPAEKAQAEALTVGGTR